MCKVQKQHSVRKCADRGRKGASRSSHNIAQSQLIESCMHSVEASQSKLCKLGSLVLTSMVRDHGQGEKQRVERKKKELTSRPGAYLAGMAGQCPRGRPGATEGRLHRGTTGSTAIGASTGVHSLTEVSSKKHSRCRGRGRRDVKIGGDREAKSRVGSHHGSPRRGGGR
jgi:hypothetical protein